MAGMSPGYFYNAGIRKAIQIFGSRFNDLQIKRMDHQGLVEKTIEVPIQYAPIQKYLARIQGDPENERNVNAVFPRISFEITNVQPDPERKINRINQIRLSNSTVYAPTPYNISFQLNIVSVNAEDGLKVLEQILPYFNPELALTAKLLDNEEQLFDVPLILDSVTMTDTYEGDFTQRRAMIWQLDFTLKYYFFGPVRNPAVIKFVKVNTYNTPEMDEIDIQYTAQPGLTADGESTTDITETIPYSDIESDDPYGFIFQINYDKEKE